MGFLDVIHKVAPTICCTELFHLHVCILCSRWATVHFLVFSRDHFIVGLVLWQLVYKAILLCVCNILHIVSVRCNHKYY